MLYNLHFFSSKCCLFHNATLFGFCISHILNTGCVKIKKKSVAKRLSLQLLNNEITWTGKGRLTNLRATSHVGSSTKKEPILSRVVLSVQ